MTPLQKLIFLVALYATELVTANDFDATQCRVSGCGFMFQRKKQSFWKDWLCGETFVMRLRTETISNAAGPVINIENIPLNQDPAKKSSFTMNQTSPGSDTFQAGTNSQFVLCIADQVVMDIELLPGDYDRLYITVASDITEANLQKLLDEVNSNDDFEYLDNVDVDFTTCDFNNGFRAVKLD